MIIDFIKIMPFEGTNSLLFSLSPEVWTNVLEERPIKRVKENFTRYMWMKSGIARNLHANGNEEVMFTKVQKNLQFNDIYLFEEDKDVVHKKMCSLDGAPTYNVGYTKLFNIGVCLIDFYHKSGSGDNRVVSVFTKGVYSEDSKRLTSLDEKDY